MRRRAFFKAAALLATGTVAGPRAVAGDVPGHSDPALGRLPEEQATLLADRVLEAYPLRRSLAEIGHVYCRELAPNGDSCRVCLEAMMDGFLQHVGLGEVALSKMPPLTIRDHIRNGNAVDFSMGRIVTVGGWLLGETEARLCAIAALRGI